MIENVDMPPRITLMISVVIVTAKTWDKTVDSLDLIP